MAAEGGRLSLRACHPELAARAEWKACASGQARPWELASRESLVIARTTRWRPVDALVVTKGLLN